MLSPTQNVPAASPTSENISVLLVSPYGDDYTALKALLSPDSWSIGRCNGASDALQEIGTGRPVLVICERDLPDGTWRTVLAGCEASSNPPALLVISRHADESLWAEVLNLGGYDVLLKPFDRVELSRVTAMACRQSLLKHPAPQPTPKPIPLSPRPMPSAPQPLGSGDTEATESFCSYTL